MLGLWLNKGNGRKDGVIRPKSSLIAVILLSAFLMASPTAFLAGEASLAMVAQPQVAATSAILIDATTGQVLYEKEPHKRVPPASITKIMTMLIAMDEVESKKVSLNDMVRTSARASQIGGSQIYLKQGEEMSLEDLLRSIAIVSANDACVSVSEYIAGTEEDFVRMMNDRARKLGMRDTHFANTNGLPAPDHYTSAHDIAIMSRELVQKHPMVLKWTSTWVDKLERTGVTQKEFDLINTNRLILTYPGADGLKTGMTDEAGWCLVGTAKRGDFRLISVVMGAASDEARISETTKLLNYGFRNFAAVPLAKAGEKVTRIRIPNGVREYVEAVAQRDLAGVVEKGKEDRVKRVIRPEPVKAPIRKGQKVGEAIAQLDGKTLARVDLLASSDVARTNIFVVILRALRNIFRAIFGLGR